MKIPFCPGYGVARNCDARCASCEHRVWKDLPEALCAEIMQNWGGRLPVYGSGTCEVRIVRPIEASGKPNLPIPGESTLRET
jgi:hypothetical protein